MKTLRTYLQIVACATVLFMSATSRAEFDWGADCANGDGHFSQAIAYYEVVPVGEIPRNKRNVRIDLDSSDDVDLQLIDKQTGTKIIAWPDGLLNGATVAEVEYQGVIYRYSGYNGVGRPGHEYIEILGDTNRELIVKAFGYIAGYAEVTYSWEAVPSCNEVGYGQFEQFIPYNETIVVGIIPQGKTNVYIELEAGEERDLDLQLVDYSNETIIVGWPDGILNGPVWSETSYNDMTIQWSGYNGIDGEWGHEEIEVVGETTVELTLKAYGYSEGVAKVNYEWGIGVGESCSDSTLPLCLTGLTCKGLSKGRKALGECHTPTWCLNDKLAQIHCDELPHPPGRGKWACETFQCVWLPKLGLIDVFEDETVVQSIKDAPFGLMQNLIETREGRNEKPARTER